MSLLHRLPLWVRVLLVVLTLYAFLVGINAMGSSFKLMGKAWNQDLLGQAAGPLLSLFLGILATTLVQSSSLSTSVIVGLVGAQTITLESGVFMVMGANIGTTVTNTIVSLGHMSRSEEYRRAFAAATVHDFFNMLTLVVLFPFELMTGTLTKAAGALTAVLTGAASGGKPFDSPVKAITKPAVSFLEDLCAQNGSALLVLSLVITFAGLILMVRILRGVVVDKLSTLFDRVLFKTPYRCLGLGLVLTVVVQSSSITTSMAVPLVGAGLIRVAQVFPFTLGANIGTTATSVLASLGVGHTLALQVALFHVLFNVLGVVLIWPFRWLPIRIAEGFANLAMRNRVLPIAYIVVVFYLLPFAIILLSRL